MRDGRMHKALQFTSESDRVLAGELDVFLHFGQWDLLCADNARASVVTVAPVRIGHERRSIAFCTTSGSTEPVSDDA